MDSIMERVDQKIAARNAQIVGISAGSLPEPVPRPISLW